jgi:hypothetical protein
LTTDYGRWVASRRYGEYSRVLTTSLKLDSDSSNDSVQNLTAYRDQTDIFFESPLDYIERRFPPTVNTLFPPSPFPTSVPGLVQDRVDEWEHEWPRHLVLFGVLLEEEGVQPLLEEKGYRQVWKAGQGWADNARRSGGVRVWRYDDTSGVSISKTPDQAR